MSKDSGRNGNLRALYRPEALLAKQQRVYGDVLRVKLAPKSLIRAFIAGAGALALGTIYLLACQHGFAWLAALH